MIVAYNLPDRDACGKLSTAAGPTAPGYKKWINQLAAAIGTGHDIVVVEPDALPDIVRGCLSPAAGCRALPSCSGTRCSDWAPCRTPGSTSTPATPACSPTPQLLAGPLERAGIRYGRGFSANVSNFQWTAAVVAWSQQLERDLGGRVGAVIDTSRNGRGPYTGPDTPQWCNPPGRALGPRPEAQPWTGRNRRLPVDQGPWSQRRPLQRRPRRRPVLAAVRGRSAPGESAPMTQDTDHPRITASPAHGLAAGLAQPCVTRPRVTRRGIQIALGVIWTMDGLLQFQPAMFTSNFATQVIAPAAVGQPVFVSGPVAETARVIMHQPAVLDLGFGLVQLALGVGILCPRATRWALRASVVWALAVWYLGEGVGGLFGGGASLLTGAPGASLLYAVLALAVAPRSTGDPEMQRPASWTAVAWAALWLGGAVLQVLPGADTNMSIGMSVAMNASGSPGWFAAIENRLSDLVPYYGVSVVVDLVVLQAAAGVGVLMGKRARSAAILLGTALTVLYWVAGQAMGQLWSGLATDPDTAPLVVLLGVAVLGGGPWRQPKDVGSPDSAMTRRRGLPDRSRCCRSLLGRLVGYAETAARAAGQRLRLAPAPDGPAHARPRIL